MDHVDQRYGVSTDMYQSPSYQSPRPDIHDQETVDVQIKSSYETPIHNFHQSFATPAVRNQYLTNVNQTSDEVYVIGHHDLDNDTGDEVYATPLDENIETPETNSTTLSTSPEILHVANDSTTGTYLVIGNLNDLSFSKTIEALERSCDRIQQKGSTGLSDAELNSWL